jgi:D-alanyl-D-alanine carboxypeptidase
MRSMPIPSPVSRAIRTSSMSGAASARLVVLLVLVALTTGIAATVVSASTLPACRLADSLTAQRSYADWDRTVLDTTYRLTTGYYPRDLRSTANAGLNSGQTVRAFVIADLKAMVRAARGAGARLAVQSAFRSYSTQKSTFAYWSRVSGYSAALKSSARAGHSEHQLGTTVDFRSYGGSAPWYYSDWGNTKAGAWLKKNAWKYGFVMSYPKGKASVYEKKLLQVVRFNHGNADGVILPADNRRVIPGGERGHDNRLARIARRETVRDFIRVRRLLPVVVRSYGRTVSIN